MNYNFLNLSILADLCIEIDNIKKIQCKFCHHVFSNTVKLKIKAVQEKK